MLSVIPIDSLFLDNCVAVAGADFNKLPLDYTIIFDNERRNRELLKQIEKTIDNGYKVVLHRRYKRKRY